MIVDFSNYRGESVTLTNSGGDLDGHTKVIIKFIVSSKLSKKDTSEIPTLINPYDHIDTENTATTRDLTLGAQLDSYERVILLLNGRMFHDPVTEIVKKDSVEA